MFAVMSHSKTNLSQEQSDLATVVSILSLITVGSQTQTTSVTYGEVLAVGVHITQNDQVLWGLNRCREQITHLFQIFLQIS